MKTPHVKSKRDEYNTDRVNIKKKKKTFQLDQNVRKNKISACFIC